MPMTAAAEIAPFDARCVRLIADLGLGAEVLAVTPLTGGVASDIARVDLPEGPVCVKFALPKLKVAADWFAPVHRNRAEYEWLAVAGSVAPSSVPRLLGRSEALNGFAMEFLQGDTVYLWKAALLAGQAPKGEAALVADVLGRIHARSTEPGFDPAPFQNRDDFRAIRLEPYLSQTAICHPDLATRFQDLSDRLFQSGTALVHGDISPKNILMRDGVPVILDAECATMGDPVFDVAFCLNHLVLKSLHLPGQSAILQREALDFWRAYARRVTWEAPSDLEARLVVLLPALMLARVDGKSPVEYLGDATQQKVRRISRNLIVHPPAALTDLLIRLDERGRSSDF